MYKTDCVNYGTIIISDGVNAIMLKDKTFTRAVTTALLRFCRNDWGCVSRDAKKRNEGSIGNPDDLYLFGIYKTCKGKIHIITDKATDNTGNNVTSILWAEEY